MARITETVDKVIFEALQYGKLSFFPLASALFAQPGDTIVFRAKSASGGYEFEADSAKPKEILFTLGFSIPGGNLGIVAGYVGFQLEKHS